MKIAPTHAINWRRDVFDNSLAAVNIAGVPDMPTTHWEGTIFARTLDQDSVELLDWLMGAHKSPARFQDLLELSTSTR